jgi:uncharacterized membrane protein YfcA
MTGETILALAAAVFVVALLYSSVGHAGASGYIATMTLFGLAPAEIRPIALVLNILVASIASYQFWRAGHFVWRLFWPFAILGPPFAFLGGYLSPSAHVFKILVGIVLFFSALQFLIRPPEEGTPSPPSRPVAAGVGAGLGLMSGLTGTGGGIFLTPLLILARWARTKNASAVSALFILFNSVAGLAGNLTATRSFPTFAFGLLAAAGMGGLIGSWFGSNTLPPLAVKRLLALVLLIAGYKLVFTS